LVNAQGLQQRWHARAFLKTYSKASMPIWLRTSAGAPADAPGQ
jgi:hypothetical protein